MVTMVSKPTIPLNENFAFPINFPPTFSLSTRFDFYAKVKINYITFINQGTA